MDFINEQIGRGITREANQVALVKTEDGGSKWTMLVPTVGP